MPQTFSEMVDAVAAETNRPDLKSEIADYLRLTIREVHFDPKSGAVAFYAENFMEAQIPVTETDSQMWTISDPARFQAMAVVRFDGRFVDGRQAYAAMVSPGPRMQLESCCYYRAGGTFVFSGYGAVGSTISLGYFQFPPGLKYYATNLRPATYDIETGWSYLPAYDADEMTREAARNLVANWLTLRWSDVLMEGLRAKVYKRLNDPRQAICYSLYMQLRNGLYTNEIADVSGPR